MVKQAQAKIHWPSICIPYPGAVVDVTDGADVDVGLRPLELRLRHCGPPIDSWAGGRSLAGSRPSDTGYSVVVGVSDFET